jgi:hypothetical protein
MKPWKFRLGPMVIFIVCLCVGPAFAWDTRWQFRQGASANAGASGTRLLEMKQQFDLDSMNTFKGTVDGSSGYTVMRNLNGNRMRGYIGRDGSGLLRDQNGDFYRVNTRW